MSKHIFCVLNVTHEFFDSGERVATGLNSKERITLNIRCERKVSKNFLKFMSLIFAEILRQVNLYFYVFILKFLILLIDWFKKMLSQLEDEKTSQKNILFDTSLESESVFIVTSGRRFLFRSLHFRSSFFTHWFSFIRKFFQFFLMT
jgi:hypothetical protein